MFQRASAFVIILVGGSFAGTSQAVPANDQTAFISGTVTDDSSGQAIPDVHVLIVGTRIGRATDMNGRYFLGPLEQGSFVIEFSHVSYEQVRDTLHLQPGDTLTYDVRLTKRSILLEEVEVIAKHPRSAYQWKGTSGRVFTRADIERTGVRGLGDLIRHMSPGASVVQVGPDLYIDFNKSSRRTTRTRPAFRDLQQTNPLIILNGQRIGKSPLSLNLLIDPEEIDEIVVLKGIEADMYGYEGRDGVILVETTPRPDTSGLSLFQKILYASAAVVAALVASFLFFW